MPITVSQLLVEVGADTTKAKTGLKEVQAETKNTGNFFTNALGGIFDFGAGLAGVAVVGFGVLSAAVGDFIAKGTEADEAQSRLNSAIDATGKITGVTSQHASDLATAMMGVTRYDDQAVQGAESIIARFSNIGAAGGIFDQTTKSALDVSQALGMALPAATKLVAKAIDDPVKGLTSLHRIGVDFTKQQVDQVKALEKSGHTMEAQNIILDQLKAHYGSAAEAAGQTFAGKLDILHNKFDNIQETIGQAMLPALSGMLDKVMPLIDAMGAALPGALDGLGQAFNSTVMPIIRAASDTFNELGKPGGALWILERQFLQLSGEINRSLPNAGGLFQALAQDIKPFATAAGSIATSLMGWAITIEQLFLPVLARLGGVLTSGIAPILSQVAGLFSGLGDTIDADSPAMDNVYNIVSALAGVFDGLVTTIQKFVIPVLADLFQWFSADILPILTKVTGAIIAEVAPALTGIGKAINQAQPFLHQLEQAFKNLLPVVTVVIGVVAALFATGMAIVVGVIHGVIGALGGIFEALGGLMQFASGFWDFITGLFLLNGDKIKAGLGEMASGIMHIFGGLFSAVGGLVSGFVSGFLGFIDNLAGGALSRFGQFVGGIFSWLGSMVHGGIDNIGKFVGSLIDGIASLPGKIIGGLNAFNDTINTWFTNLIQGAANFIGTFIQRMIDGITSAATRFGSSLHDMVSSAVHNIPVIGSLIPAFASGGVSPGGRILVGEDGPEIVDSTPGDRIYNARETAALMGSRHNTSGGHGGPIHIVIEYDGRVIAEQVLENMPGIVRLHTGTKI